MIGLRNEVDQNNLCLLWEQERKVVAYRYKSIVFGYTASPFILHYVIKMHVSNFPIDKCSNILKENFYVDNLILKN